jgi:lipoate-protein ligase A
MALKIYKSIFTNPYLNLAIEDFLYTRSTASTLLFYRNSPSVIVGRNQNVWKQLSLSSCYKDDIDIVRRLSGGGTVYHDLNNTNYCFMTGTLDRLRVLLLLQQSLHSMSIPVTISSRHDLLLEGKKISGSAFKVGRQRCYSHGTMLIDTDLDRLERYLTPKELNMEGWGTDSVRSTVSTLNDYVRSSLGGMSNVIPTPSYQLRFDLETSGSAAKLPKLIDHDGFCANVARTFHSYFNQTKNSAAAGESVQQRMDDDFEIILIDDAFIDQVSYSVSVSNSVFVSSNSFSARTSSHSLRGDATSQTTGLIMSIREKQARLASSEWVFGSCPRWVLKVGLQSGSEGGFELITSEATSGDNEKSSTIDSNVRNGISGDRGRIQIEVVIEKGDIVDVKIIPTLTPSASSTVTSSLSFSALNSNTSTMTDLYAELTRELLHILKNKKVYELKDIELNDIQADTHVKSIVQILSDQVQ